MVALLRRFLAALKKKRLAYEKAGIPQGKKIDYMRDIDNRYNHGGGTFAYDGSNLIPVGVLKEYQGPCPVSYHPPRYEITVKAIDENGNVIAFGKKMKKYTPEPE